jgi:hypothetical protein
VEADFLRPLITTLVVGSLIMGTGAWLLFLAFRAAGEKAGERRFVGLSITLIAFVFVCCALFFVWSIVT